MYETSNAYCDFDSTAVKGVQGNKVLIAVWTDKDTKPLAVEGQTSADINRSASTSTTATKDNNGWDINTPGSKNWSISLNSLFILGGSAQEYLEKAFANNWPVCLVGYLVGDDGEIGKSLFGGLAYITTLNISAPTDGAATASATFTGTGKLTNLAIENDEEEA